MPSILVLPALTAASASGGALRTSKPRISTKAISSAITTPTSPASGRCFQKPSRKRSVLRSSIITTNRNNTITAPTYTSTSAMARNSARSSSHRHAALPNASTRYSAACTVLRAVMTRTLANSSTSENR